MVPGVIAATKSDRAVGAAAGESIAVRFAIGALWALVGAVVSRGLTLAASVLAGRLLGTTGFGEIGMIQSTQGLFGVVAGAGLGLAATKFVAEYRSTDPARAGRSATLATTIAWVSGALIALVLFLLSGVIASGVLNASHLTGELQVATGLVLFGTINGVQTGALVGFGAFRALAVLNGIRGVCLCVFLIAGIEWGGVLGGVIGLILTEAITVLANHVALRRLLPETVAWPERGAAGSELMTMCRFSGLSLLGSICAAPAMGLFGPEYRAGGMTLVILSASSVAVALNNLLGQVLVSQGAIMGRFLLDCLLAAVLAIVSWQLIPLYRDQGMALASLIAFAVTAAALIATTIHLMGAGEKSSRAVVPGLDESR
jgi:O-antigen/teichoic acid export membrane protein